MGELHDRHRRVMPDWISLYYDQPLEIVSGSGSRGKGLMFAVDPVTQAPSPGRAARVLEAARERGLLIGKGGLFGHALRMAPPMTLTEAEAKEGLGLLTDALRAVDEEATR
jgi:4-aminobutyrate aminotransferase